MLTNRKISSNSHILLSCMYPNLKAVKNKTEIQSTGFKYLSLRQNHIKSLVSKDYKHF